MSDTEIASAITTHQVPKVIQVLVVKCLYGWRKEANIHYMNWRHVTFIICITIKSYALVPGDTDLIHYVPASFKSREGLSLDGHLAVPKTRKPPYPTVIMYVGSGAGNRFEDVSAKVTIDGLPHLLLKPVEEALIRTGFAVFAYDKRGVYPQDPTFLKNKVDDAIWQSATAINLAADALAAYDYVAAIPIIDPSNVVLLGHSEGTALALKVAEQRNFKGLIYLGLFVRNLKDLIEFQSVISMDRYFYIIDDNFDGELDPSETKQFLDRSGNSFKDLLSAVDANQDQFISMHEWRYFFKSDFEDFLTEVSSSEKPWKYKTPKLWFKQYFDEGPFLARHSKFCEKIFVIQGELDDQTPYEEALSLKATCSVKQTPLAALIGIPKVGHAFSPRRGYRNWQNTLGPFDSKAIFEISKAAKSILNR